MKKYFTSSLGRLRLLSIIEGLSLIALVFIAVPIKYFGDNPYWVKTIGPIHGGLFVFFVLAALMEASARRWSFKTSFWVIGVASFIPFGCFYIDAKVLKPMAEAK